MRKHNTTLRLIIAILLFLPLRVIQGIAIGLFAVIFPIANRLYMARTTHA